jgi:hypothetical protein
VAVYHDRSEHEANQGDLFEDVPLECAWPAVEKSTVMVISHDCECDKYLKPNTPLTETEKYEWRTTVALVHPITQLTGGRPDAVRRDAMPRYLLLPDENDMGELVVDLWTTQPVRMATLLECERRASLSDDWRNRLWWKIIRLRLGAEYKQILQGGPLSDAA